MESEGSNSSGEDEAHNWVPKFNKRFGQGYLRDMVRLGDLGKSESSTDLDELAENVRVTEGDDQPMGLVNNESTVSQPALDASLNPESSRAEGDLYDVVRNYLEALGKLQSRLNLDELPVNVRAAEAKNKCFDEVCKDSEQGKNNLDWGDDAVAKSNPNTTAKEHAAGFMPGHPVQQPIPSAESMMMDTIMASYLMGCLSNTLNQESSARAGARRQKRRVLIKEAKSREKEGEAEMLLPSKSASETRYQLHRTRSSSI